MKLSVVVICWNSLANLRQLMSSLPDAVADIDHEIIIVDNGSTDGTDSFLARHYPQVVYQRLDSNHGVAYARNRGIEIAQGEYVWILDDDTIVGKEAVTAMINHLDSVESCGITGCRLVDSNDNIQQSFKTFPGVGVKLRNLLGVKTDSYATQLAAGMPFSPEYIIGACQMVRMTVFKTIGLLDEKIFYGPEDADFCIRARKAGWTVDFLPQVSIVHKWKRITNRSPFSVMALRHFAALIYFYAKHRRLF